MKQLSADSVTKNMTLLD